MKTSAGWALGAAVFAAYAAAILAAPHPPYTVDLPDWVYQSVLVREAWSGVHAPGVSFRSYPVPNTLVTLTLALLQLVVSWSVAARLLMVLYLACAWLGARSLVRALKADVLWLPLALPGLAFLNLDFWFGHVAFQWGFAGALWLIAMLVSPPKGVRWKLPLLLVAIFFAHMEACAVAGLAVVLFAVWRREMRLLLSLVPAGLLTVWYGTVRHFQSSLVFSGHPLVERGSFAARTGNRIFKPMGFVHVFGDDVSYSVAMLGRTVVLIGAIAAFVFGIVLIVAAIRFARRSQGAERPLMVLAGLLFLIGVVLPPTVLGTSDPGSRILLCGLVIAMFCLHAHRKVGALLATISLALCLVNLYQMVELQRRTVWPTETANLPMLLGRFARVEPEHRVFWYDLIRDGNRSAFFFPTGILAKQVPEAK